MPYRMSVVIGEQQLSIFNGNTSSSFYYFWLRDHCRCDACYNHETFQRKSDIGGIDIDIKPNNWNLAEDKLQVTCKYATVMLCEYKMVCAPFYPEVVIVYGI